MSLNRLGWAVATGFVLLPLSAAVMAQAEYAGWAVTPRVSISQIYSDNIDLAPRGEEDDEFVTQLDAGVALRREGSRARARLNYNLTGLAYWSDSDSNEIFHQLDADGRADLVQEHLFLEASAIYDQRLRSRSGRTGDIVNTGVDRTDVFQLRVSPVYVHRFADAAAAELRYDHSRVYYVESDARDVDSERNRVLATLDSGPMFSRFGWGLSFDRSEEDFDDGSSVTFQTAEALGRWNFTERLSVFGVVGDEQNSFEQDPSRATPDDTFWRAGATFRPTARTFTEAYVGERFFGTTYGATVRRDLRDGRLFADYNEELRTVNQPDDLRLIRDEFGDPIFDPTTGQPIFELPDLLTGVYLRKRFSAGVSIRRTKTDWGVRLFDERREYELTDQREEVQGVIGDVSWRVLPRTRVFANARIEESTFADERDREDTLFDIRLGVSRDLGPQTSASVDYLYRERESTEDAREYIENRLTATFTKVF
jgi:uncharacterized protein (PEP-CTERM system associated)